MCPRNPEKQISPKNRGKNLYKNLLEKQKKILRKMKRKKKDSKQSFIRFFHVNATCVNISSPAKSAN